MKQPDQTQTTAQKPGDALRAAGIEPANPWEFLARRMPNAKITPAIANELAAQTGTSSQFWLNMQRAYQGHD